MTQTPEPEFGPVEQQIIELFEQLSYEHQSNLLDALICFIEPAVEITVTEAEDA